jgi:hypothetical protein
MSARINHVAICSDHYALGWKYAEKAMKAS